MDLRSALELKREFRELVRFMVRESKIIFYGLRTSVLSFLGAVMITFFVLIALLAPLLAPPEPDPYICPYEGPHGYIIIHPLPTFPSPEHLFGTLDGYDIYYGCIWGTRTAFRIALLAISIELAVGLLVGCIGGYFGGLLDELMMRLTDIFLAFPRILFALIFVVALPTIWSLNIGPLSLSIPFSPLDKLAIAVAIAGWPLYSRLIRGEIIRVKTQEYVEAAKANGCSGVRILTKHLLPNAIYPVLIMAFLDFGGITLSTTTLSFLGFGPQAYGYAEWGTMIGNSRRFLFWSFQEPLKYVHTFLFPTLFLSAFALGWSLIGDTLRNTLDPVLRRK